MGKNLFEVFNTHERRVAMNGALEDLCFGSTLTFDDDDFNIERSIRRKLHLFYNKFLMEKEFIQYFQNKWEPCIGMF